MHIPLKEGIRGENRRDRGCERISFAVTLEPTSLIKGWVNLNTLISLSLSMTGLGVQVAFRPVGLGMRSGQDDFHYVSDRARCSGRPGSG